MVQTCKIFSNICKISYLQQIYSGSDVWLPCSACRTTTGASRKPWWAELSFDVEARICNPSRSLRNSSKSPALVPLLLLDHFPNRSWKQIKTSNIFFDDFLQWVKK